MTNAGAAESTAGGAAAEPRYDYIARRPLAVVALAEARGVDPARGPRGNRAARRRARHVRDPGGAKGHALNGAARVVVQIDGDGRVAADQRRIDPGAGVAQNAVVCLVAPAKMLAFPPADAGTRGMAVEALWGHVQAR